jgi:hypothetical protein
MDAPRFAAKRLRGSPRPPPLPGADLVRFFEGSRERSIHVHRSSPICFGASFIAARISASWSLDCTDASVALVGDASLLAKRLVSLCRPARRFR